MKFVPRSIPRTAEAADAVDEKTRKRSGSKTRNEPAAGDRRPRRPDDIVEGGEGAVAGSGRNEPLLRSRRHSKLLSAFEKTDVC